MTYLVVLSVAVCLPLLFIRRFPLSMAALSAVAAMIGTGIDVGWPGRLVAVAAFCVAAYHRPRPGPVLAASLTWTFAFAALAGSPGAGVLPLADLVIMGVAPMAAGYAVRLQRERGEQVARLAVAEDRARLARDMHDSVGHHLTAIRMQAVAAQRVPESAQRAVRTIAELSATALTEVRCLVGQLRTEDDIGTLAERMSGPDRRIRTHGTAAGLPPAISQAAYRIVQEALTNAVRHSPATEIDVRLRRHRGQVVVLVQDNGGAGEAVEGNGIRGMRERVDRLGGMIHIGPGRAGWRVEASLPVRR
ncbi:MAG: sensor histidine kinase [Kibdelosporangium sp.]